jgi:hypothetical protein
VILKKKNEYKESIRSVVNNQSKRRKTRRADIVIASDDHRLANRPPRRNRRRRPQQPPNQQRRAIPPLHLNLLLIARDMAIVSFSIGVCRIYRAALRPNHVHCTTHVDCTACENDAMCEPCVTLFGASCQQRGACAANQLEVRDCNPPPRHCSEWSALGCIFCLALGSGASNNAQGEPLYCHWLDGECIAALPPGGIAARTSAECPCANLDCASCEFRRECVWCNVTYALFVPAARCFEHRCGSVGDAVGFEQTCSGEIVTAAREFLCCSTLVVVVVELKSCSFSSYNDNNNNNNNTFAIDNICIESQFLQSD